MSLSVLVGSHLPHLRRYARALTGSQKSGDAYVRQLLETLIEDPDLLKGDANPRAGLYRAFMRLWSDRMHEPGSDEEPPSAFDRNLGALTPRSRQAFLLRFVEGFSLAETAMILGASEPDATLLLHRAGQEMAQQVATDVLIIEDEPIIAMDLAAIIGELGHTVAGMARTRSEARRLMTNLRPGLVLADIQLADGSSGLDAVNDLLGDIEVPVIFVTAYPERLLTGDRPEPTFLITKPYRPEVLKVTISQALFFDQRSRKSA